MNSWKELLKIILEHPIIGTGIGAIQQTLVKLKGYSYVPHNDYIRLAAESGIVALIFYVYFNFKNMIYFLKGSNRYSNWQINYPISVSIIYFSSLSFFQNIVYNVIVFPMFTGLIALGQKAEILYSINSSEVNNA
jgi:O-antigen ligase